MYDVLILSANQKAPSIFQSAEITVIALNNEGDYRPKYYHEIWPFINNSDGILYKVFTDGDFFEHECGDDLFNFYYDKNNKKRVPEFYSSCTEIAEDLVSFSVKKDHQDSFFDLLQKMLYSSPTNTFLFLCRGQSHDKEILLGALPLSRFLQMLTDGDVCTNVCYIVST